MIMSRMYSAAGDWSLECHFDGRTGRPQFLLSLSLTTRQVQQLTDSGINRGLVFESGLRCVGWVYVKNIELTQAEAEQVAHGTDPRDVLFPARPACGYRLVAVPDPLLGGGWT